MYKKEFGGGNQKKVKKGKREREEEQVGREVGSFLWNSFGWIWEGLTLETVSCDDKAHHTPVCGSLIKT